MTTIIMTDGGRIVIDRGSEDETHVDVSLYANRAFDPILTGRVKLSSLSAYACKAWSEVQRDRSEAA
jgi:hypothetical protein